MSLRRLCLLALAPLALLVAAHVAAQWRDGFPASGGRLAGPDAYMRLVRVEALWQTGNWYDDTIARSNAPHGEVLHWTRPMDVLLLAGAVPLAPFLGIDAALYWWGVLVSPLLQVLALLALMWAASSLLPPRGLVLLGLLFAAQFYLAFQFGIGRPDHHGLILLLTVWSLGFALRLVAADAAPATAKWAAVPAALGLWVSVEGLVPLAIIAAVLLAAWIAGRRNAAANGRAFALTLLMLVMAAFVAERPPAKWLSVEYDQLSVVHLLALALHAAFWFAVQRLPAGLERWRLGVLGLAAGVAGLAVLRMLFDGVLAGPMADVDPHVIEFWYRDNREVSPLIDPANMAASLPKAVAHLGWALLALPLLAWRIRQGQHRRQWLVLLLATVVALPLALHEVRWTGLAQVVLLIPYATLLTRMLDRLPEMTVVTPIIRGLLVAGFAVGPLAAGAMLQRNLPASEVSGGSCDLAVASGLLNRRFPDPRTVAGFIFDGPELLYRTRHRVVGTPYHRNGEGILDTIALFSATDMEIARDIAGRRGIGLLLVCPGNSEADNYRRGTMPASLMTRLDTSRLPAWLHPVDVRNEPAGGYRLFEIRP